MYKLTKKYETFDGDMAEDTFYFYLSKAEVTKWLTQNGGYTLDKLLVKMTQESKARDIMDVFDDLIKKSFGKPSLDGKRFEKSPKLTEEFCQTEAYSDLFMELVSSGKKAGEFITKILPKDLSKEVETIMKENPDGIPDELKDYLPDKVVEMPGVGMDA